jgi:primase-polymerase (primpol)-like protein
MEEETLPGQVPGQALSATTDTPAASHNAVPGTPEPEPGPEPEQEQEQQEPEQQEPEQEPMAAEPAAAESAAEFRDKYGRAVTADTPTDVPADIALDNVPASHDKLLRLSQMINFIRKAKNARLRARKLKRNQTTFNPSKSLRTLFEAPADTRQSGAHGQVEFQPASDRKVTKKDAASLREARQAQLMKLDIDLHTFQQMGPNEQQARVRTLRQVVEFMKTTWQMKMPSVVFSVTGNAASFEVTPPQPFSALCMVIL